MGSHPKMLGIKDIVLGLEDTAQLLRETSRTSLNATAWYAQLNEESKDKLAQLGRQLLNLIIKYITEPSHREETVQLTRDMGCSLGETLAVLELPLTDSVEAFLLHRDPILNAVTHLMKKREAFTGRVVESIPMVGHIMDEALLALVAAHQQHRDGTAEVPARGTAG
jgi:hypothetical protein